ncbi:hypothetical protein [Burkholderia pyrrocinia]|uniref:hypothetical protein n=1 Tax=Burkholderia pyrrocinia TaxID=60550 RepID=UPI00158F26EA|nr:hypothetical protein [Burkholderia pyrrocinia]
MDYTTLTPRAEQELRDYLDRAAKHHAADDFTSEVITRGAALGMLSLWEGLVAALDGSLEPHFLADRTRLSALIHSEAAAPDTQP